jgi:hypothetical protein
MGQPHELGASNGKTHISLTRQGMVLALPRFRKKKHGTEADHACHVRVLWKLDQNVAK